MSIEHITGKILADAKKAANEILGEAQKEADAIITEAEQKAKAKIEGAKKDGMDAEEKLISRKASVASIDAKKMILQEKQNCIA